MRLPSKNVVKCNTPISIFPFHPTQCRRPVNFWWVSACTKGSKEIIFITLLHPGWCKGILIRHDQFSVTLPIIAVDLNLCLSNTAKSNRCKNVWSNFSRYLMILRSLHYKLDWPRKLWSQVFCTFAICMSEFGLNMNWPNACRCS